MIEDLKKGTLVDTVKVVHLHLIVTGDANGESNVKSAL